MKVTNVLLRGVKTEMMFKTHWLLQRRCKIVSTPAESILASKGIQIFDMKDVLRPPLIEEPYVPHVDEVSIPEEKEPCFILDNNFHPLAKLDQSQIITNSLVFSSFPNKVLDKIQPLKKEEQQYFKEIVLHSLLLDAEQKKLKRVGEFQKYPGYKARREYGIKPEKKITSLLYQILLHLDETSSNEEFKNVIQNVSSRVTLNHGDKLMHLHSKVKFMVCSQTPLEPVMTKEEVNSLEGEPLPDIYPLSPFVHSKSLKHYNFTDEFSVKGGALAPHTVFIANTERPFLIDAETFHGMTLVHAFSLAASYAKEVNKEIKGRLDKPVTLNIVHTNGQYIHTGVYQLNTLDCMDSVRNIFWHQPPWESLYDKIGFDIAQPTVENLNTKPLAVLKALY